VTKTTRNTGSRPTRPTIIKTLPTAVPALFPLSVPATAVATTHTMRPAKNATSAGKASLRIHRWRQILIIAGT